MNIDPAASQADVKRFADRVLKRLERDGAALKFPQILEALSAGFGERNWSALCGRLSEEGASARDTPHASQSAAARTAEGRSMAANIQWSWPGQPRICTADDPGAGRDHDIVCWHVPRGEKLASNLRLIRLLAEQKNPAPVLVIHAPWMDKADVGKLDAVNGALVVVLTHESFEGRRIEDSRTLCDELEMLFLDARQEEQGAKASALGSVERDGMAIRSLSMLSTAQRAKLERYAIQASGHEAAASQAAASVTWDGSYHWSYPARGERYAPRNRRSPFHAGWTTDIHLVVGPPGHGKSVLASAASLDLMLGPVPNGIIPMLGMVDVGGAAANAFATMSGILAARGRGRALHRKWNALSTERINVFDTRLGCRIPGRKTYVDIANFLCLLTQSGHHLDRGMGDLCRTVVREVYERFSDLSRGGQPKLYVPGRAPCVDQALSAKGIAVSDLTTWWSCTDSLFAAGDVEAARTAQSHAVPLVEDVVRMANSPVVAEIFGNATVDDGGERLVEAFQCMVSASLRAYPALGGPGSLDIRGYDAVCLDIDMAGSFDEKALAVSALLAHHAVSHGMYSDMNDGTMVYPERYESHLRNEANAWRERRHALTWDECHRFCAFAAVRMQLELDMREGRKWGVDIMACSQTASVFEGGISSLANGVWLMGTGTQAQADATARALNLPQDVIRHASEEAWEWSTAKGFKVLNFNMGDPRIEKLRMVRFRFDAGMRWMLCTSSGEAALVRTLVERIGLERAVHLLIARFPNGPGDHVARRAREMEMASSHGRLNGGGESAWRGRAVDAMVQEMTAEEGSRS